ncbi:MAG: hypothetical protein GJV46_15275 [Geobacter sp.]|nr:hypothetical protein [Geobacter sp.]
MDFKFSKGTGESERQEAPGEKKNQSALLVLLLLLVGGFSYIYFFTGLIKPQVVPPPAAVPAPQVVKMPLPVRDGVVAGTEQKTDAAKTEPAAAKGTASQAAAVAKPAPVAAVAPAPVAKTALPVKPKDEPKKTEPAKVAENKVVPAKVETKKPAAEKTATVAAKKSEPVKSADNKHTVATAKPKKVTAVPVAATKADAGRNASAGSWSLVIGQYAIEEALSVDMGRVRKAGLTPVVKPGLRKKTTMNRLFLADFASRADAQAELTKLKRYTSDAFIIDQAGKNSVFAGSYLLDSRASTEKERLSSAGFAVSIKRVEVAIPTQSLTVGPFSDKKSAESALGKLKGVGIKAALIRP